MTAVRRRLSRVLSGVVLAAVVAAGVLLIAAPRAVDGHPLTVLSGSMSGTYEIGDVVVVRPVEAEKLRAGDVITFQPVSDNPSLTTHRITAVTYGSEGTRFVTQGDANGAADPEPVRPEQVMGEVWYSVPMVGYASVWLAGDRVRTLVNLGSGGLVLYGAWLMASGLLDRRSRRRRGREVAPA